MSMRPPPLCLLILPSIHPSIYPQATIFRKVLTFAVAAAFFTGCLTELATADPDPIPADITVVYSKMPNRQRCGQGVWFNSKIIINDFNDAGEILCGVGLSVYIYLCISWCMYTYISNNFKWRAWLPVIVCLLHSHSHSHRQFLFTHNNIYTHYVHKVLNRRRGRHWLCPQGSCHSFQTFQLRTILHDKGLQ